MTHVKSGQKKVEKDLEKDTESETINLRNKKNCKAPDAYFKRNGVNIFVECSRKKLLNLCMGLYHWYFF